MTHRTTFRCGLIAGVMLMAAAATSVAQRAASSPASLPVDPQIAAALKQVSAKRIRTTIEKLASAPAPPANVRIEAQKLVNDSTLLWDPSPDGRATSHEILWRATTSSDWEHLAPAADPKQATLRLSKDNVIFGVRAVDAQVHRSLVVLPRPN